MEREEVVIVGYGNSGENVCCDRDRLWTERVNLLTLSKDFILRD